MSQHDPLVSPETQSYATFLRNLRDRYPNLINLERELEKPAYKRDCKVRLIDLPPSAESGWEFHSAPELRKHLGTAETVTPARRCRIYVVENLSLEYITVIGNHFYLDPTIFAAQIRAQVWAEQPTENNTPPLLRHRYPRHSFTLRYKELRYFDEPIAGLDLVNNRAGRRITTTNTQEELSVFRHVGVVRRCLSFWCREGSNTGSWDGSTSV
jgi:hypothetical protein